MRELLGTQLVIADGAMGTVLQDRGLKPGEAPMLWSLTHPEEVIAVHRAYLEAGARLITSNSFGVNALELNGKPYSVVEVVTAAVELAREAVAQQQQESTAFVALDISSLGHFLEPLGDLTFEEALDLFKEQVTAGAAAGAEVVLIETMIDHQELKAAVLAAKEASDLPVFATVSVDEQGRLLTGVDLAFVSALLDELGVDAMGLNCGAGPTQVAPCIKELSTLTKTPLILNPNAGLPLYKEGRTVYPLQADEFARLMQPLADEYLAIAGGCCGTTPAHIAALAAKIHR